MCHMLKIFSLVIEVTSSNHHFIGFCDLQTPIRRVAGTGAWKSG